MEPDFYENCVYQKERKILTREETGNYQILEEDGKKGFRYTVACGETGKIELECSF